MKSKLLLSLFCVFCSYGAFSSSDLSTIQSHVALCKQALMADADYVVTVEQDNLMSHLHVQDNPFINVHLYEQLCADYEHELPQALANIPLIELSIQELQTIQQSLDRLYELLQLHGIHNCKIAITSNPHYQAMTVYSKETHYLFFHPHFLESTPIEIQQEVFLHEIEHMLAKDGLTKMLILKAMQRAELLDAPDKDIIELEIEGKGIANLMKAQEDRATIFGVLHNAFYKEVAVIDKESGNPPCFNEIRDQLAAAEQMDRETSVKDSLEYFLPI